MNNLALHEGEILLITSWTEDAWALILGRYTTHTTTEGGCDCGTCS